MTAIPKLIRVLLDHKGLMTPVLNQQFGPIKALQTKYLDEVEYCMRQSRLVQASTGKIILSAELKINGSMVPQEFLRQLVSTTIPFGALLVQFHIETTIQSLNLFCHTSAQTTDSVLMDRWGRRHNIVDPTNGNVLCEVEELLMPCAHLKKILVVAAG